MLFECDSMGTVTNWRELYGIFTRCTQEKSLSVEQHINSNRRVRTLDGGEQVFRKFPAATRLPVVACNVIICLDVTVIPSVKPTILPPSAELLFSMSPSR